MKKLLNNFSWRKSKILQGSYCFNIISISSKEEVKRKINNNNNNSNKLPHKEDK